MTNKLTFVILSSGLENFKELRAALATQEGARVLVGGDDPEQVFPEIERLAPSACVVALGAEPEANLRFVERVARECPRTAVICAARDSSPDTILRSMRAGAREFLRLPVRPEEFATVYQRIAEFCAVQPAPAKKRGRVLSIFSSKICSGTSPPTRRRVPSCAASAPRSSLKHSSPVLRIAKVSCWVITLPRDES
jgi:DNA-binding NarL/FixJ family response regulator